MRSVPTYLIPFALCLLALVGCKAEEEIRTETVEHASREKIRLRVAYFTRGQWVWYAQLSGPAAEVKKHEAAFEAYVKSMNFDAKKDPPFTFTEPKDWKKDPPGNDPKFGERVAAFRIDAKPKELEVVLTRYPAGAKFKDARPGVSPPMTDFHDWQKDLNLPLSETAEEANKLLTREKIGEQDVAWLALENLGVHIVSRPPDPQFAQANKKNVGLLGMGGKVGGGPKLPFAFKMPEAWERRPARQLVHAVFAVKDTEITISAFGGDIGENLSRWRGQVELPAIDNADVVKAAARRNVLGVDSYYVDYDNPKGPAGKDRIVGVLVPGNPQHWFIKMTGPRDEVGEQKPAFEAFVDSFKR